MTAGLLLEVGAVKEVGKVALMMPLNVVVAGLVAVAFADNVTVVPMVEIFVPDGMPAPLMTCPVASPVVLDTGVRVVLPLVTMPVIVTVPVAEAA
jgi:hypothetical protein